jgi:hypothetical protein
MGIWNSGAIGEKYNIVLIGQIGAEFNSRAGGAVRYGFFAAAHLG